jgi:hypothetical protein
MSDDGLNGEGDCIVKLDGQLIADLDGHAVRLGRITSIDSECGFLGSVSRICMNDGDGNSEVTIKITCDLSAVDRSAVPDAANDAADG